MRFLKQRTLWFALYGVGITAVFLYLLFPADIVKDRFEAQASSTEFSFKMESLQPSLPLGIKLRKLSVTSGNLKDIYYQGEVLDLQANLLGILKKPSSISLNGEAYGGNFNGRIFFPSWSKVFPPVEATLSFHNIDLGKYYFFKSQIGRDITGKVRGSLLYENAMETYSKLNGNIKLFITKGSYLLVDPFLGINRIEIDRGEIQAQVKNGMLKIEKLETFGPQVNCSIKGEITIAPDLKNSQLKLTGIIESLSKNKMKANITINGTLANPITRYI
jgi:type II secretion system protein N